MRFVRSSLDPQRIFLFVTIRFPCGRWLGKGVDDDSLERVLFVDDSMETSEFNENLPNSSSDFGSPSISMMTSSFISGGSQANLSLVGRSRSPSLRRAHEQSTSRSLFLSSDCSPRPDRLVSWLADSFPRRKTCMSLDHCSFPSPLSLRPRFHSLFLQRINPINKQMISTSFSDVRSISW